jgi:hypothetical protein
MGKSVIRQMKPNNMSQPKQGQIEPLDGDALARKERELLARVREVAQRITERVAKVLDDTGTHAALPTQEHPALANGSDGQG